MKFNEVPPQCLVFDVNNLYFLGTRTLWSWLCTVSASCNNDNTMINDGHLRGVIRNLFFNEKKKCHRWKDAGGISNFALQTVNDGSAMICIQSSCSLSLDELESSWHRCALLTEDKETHENFIEPADSLHNLVVLMLYVSNCTTCSTNSPQIAPRSTSMKERERECQTCEEEGQELKERILIENTPWTGPNMRFHPLHPPRCLLFGRDQSKSK